MKKKKEILKMSLKIVGHRLLVKPDPLEEQINLPETLKESNFKVHKSVTQQKMEEAGTQTGTVIQVGSTAWRSFDGQDIFWKPWCKEGDRIIFARYSGKFVEDPDTKERFMVINDDDVQAVITTPIKDIFGE